MSQRLLLGGRGSSPVQACSSEVLPEEVLEDRQETMMIHIAVGARTEGTSLAGPNLVNLKNPGIRKGTSAPTQAEPPLGAPMGILGTRTGFRYLHASRSFLRRPVMIRTLTTAEAGIKDLGEGVILVMILLTKRDLMEVEGPLEGILLVPLAEVLLDHQVLPVLPVPVLSSSASSRDSLPRGCQRTRRSWCRRSRTSPGFAPGEMLC